MNVEPRATAQPASCTARSTAEAGPDSVQTTPPTGRQAQNSRASARVAASTNVARSAGPGTTRVSQRLNHERAMTVCCTANSASNPTSMATASGQPERTPSSMSLGTAKPAKNPTA